MAHKYPKDLVDTLYEMWPTVERGSGLDDSVHALPNEEVLEDLISTCYQVSQLEEESRGLRFRMMLCEPHVFEEEETSKDITTFVLRFSEPRPFNEYELMKLGPSVDFYTSMIGVRIDELEGLQVWGIVHSGSSWTHTIHGGSKAAHPLPPCLGLNVVGAGRVTACRGLIILAQLSGGNIITPSINVFQSKWIKERFMAVKDHLFARHRKNIHYSPEQWANIHPDFVGDIYQEFFKHVISTIRRSNHGGILLSLPADTDDDFSSEDSLISIKYQFQGNKERKRLQFLILEIMESLAKICGKLYGADYEAGWSDYVSLRDEGLAHLDEQVYEFARFIATMAAIDGAVVTTEGPEIIGFGGIIQGTYQMGQSVARAIDPEGTQKQIERIEGVGTRHRALYYLCSKMPEVLGIVISQDGKVRTVSWNNNIVTCWDVIPIDFT